MESVHLQLPADLLARVDEARKTPLGTVARNAWIRDAIELYARQAEQAVALASETHNDALEDFLATVHHLDGGMPLRLEAWQKAVVKRDVQPRPKGGK